MPEQTPIIFDNRHRDSPSSCSRWVNAAAPLRSTESLIMSGYMSKRSQCQWALNCHAPHLTCHTTKHGYPRKKTRQKLNQKKKLSSSTVRLDRVRIRRYCASHRRDDDTARRETPPTLSRDREPHQQSKLLPAVLSASPILAWCGKVGPANRSCRWQRSGEELGEYT